MKNTLIKGLRRQKEAQQRESGLSQSQMNKPSTYVFLPTDKTTNLFLSGIGQRMYCNDVKQRSYDSPQHLYLISDYDIKGGDWQMIFFDEKYRLEQYMVDGGTKQSWQKHDRSGLIAFEKKIIATTNPELFRRPISQIGLSPQYASSKLDVPPISQSDIEYIISLYNGKGKEVDVKKIIFDLLNKHLPKNTQWTIEAERGVQNAMKEIYNQCLQDNADKKFTLGDLTYIFGRGINCGLEHQDPDEICANAIKFLTKEQPKSDTVIVEYEHIESMGYIKSGWIPKLDKDGNICIVR